MRIRFGGIIGAAWLACGTAALAGEAAFGPPAVAVPRIPAGRFDVTQYGAVGDGRTDNTAAIAVTIAACVKAGGGTVVVPKGRFLSGRIRLASSLELHLDADATLLLDDADTAYRNAKGGNDSCITADHCHDIAITGSGTIDGQGARWWDAFRKIKGTPAQSEPANHRPYMVALSDCERVRVSGVTLTNSPSFHLVPGSCSDVTVDHVRFVAPKNAPNTDALDPSGWRHSITHCTFDTGDDCIAIKPAGRAAGGHASCEDFYVADCTFLHGHGLSIGGQTPGGLRRLRVQRCTFADTDAGIRMKANRGTGGPVEDVAYDTITMTRVKVPIYITSYYPQTPPKPQDDPAQAVTDKTPVWRNIRISNLTVTDSPEAGRIIGLPEMPVGDVLLTNVKMDCGRGLQVVNAASVRFESSSIRAKSGPFVMATRSSVSGLAGG